MNGVWFEETQMFRQPLLWIALGVVFCVSIGLQAYFLAYGERSGSNVLALGLSMAVFLIVIVVLYISRLDVKVDAEGLHTRFYPFELSFRDTGWSDMTGRTITTVKPMEHGGWGLRMGSKSKAYIVSGNKGVSISLTNGRTLLVGTRRPEELAAALDRGGKK